MNPSPVVDDLATSTRGQRVIVVVVVVAVVVGVGVVGAGVRVVVVRERMWIPEPA